MQSASTGRPPACNLPEPIEALNRLRDTLTMTAMELRDLEFDLDTVQRHHAIDHANEFLKAVK
jgi:hypothetical protein